MMIHCRPVGNPGQHSVNFTLQEYASHGFSKRAIIAARMGPARKLR